MCVIGADVKKQLFGARSAVVGSKLSIDSLPYRIVGVMAQKIQNASYRAWMKRKSGCLIQP